MGSLQARMLRFARDPAPHAARTSLALLPDEIAQRLSTPLAHRLARLRPSINIATARGPESDVEVAARCAGRVIGPGLIKIEQRLPLPWRHGSLVLNPLRFSAVSQPLFNLNSVDETSSLLFLDTETSGLAGGTGTTAFNIGLTRVENARLITVQYLMLRPSAEAMMLNEVINDLAGITHLITYNGKSFDIPLLRTRLRLANLLDPFSTIEHLDLLHIVRRIRPSDWPDARLATVEQKLIGFTRENDLPGDAIPPAWQAWLRVGNATDLARIVTHNRLDLISLYALLLYGITTERTSFLMTFNSGDDLFANPPHPATNVRSRIDFIHALLNVQRDARLGKLV